MYFVIDALKHGFQLSFPVWVPTRISSLGLRLTFSGSSGSRITQVFPEEAQGQPISQSASQSPGAAQIMI